MRKPSLLFVMVISSLVVASSAFSMQSAILDKRNEFGGSTVEETYSPGDPQYRQGLARLVQHFDGNNRMIKLESFFNAGHTMLDGIDQTVQYFDNRFYRPGIRTRVEFTYTDAYAAGEGLARAIEYYDEDERRTRIAYFYTEAYAKKRLTSRLEVIYDPKGSVVTRTYTDMNGKVLSIEVAK